MIRPRVVPGSTSRSVCEYSCESGSVAGDSAVGQRTVQPIEEYPIGAPDGAPLEPWIRSMREDAIDRILVCGDPTDLAAAYVRSMPTSVIARLVGASADDHEQIAAWVDELSNSKDLSRNRGPRGRRRHRAVDPHRGGRYASTDNEILAIVALMLQAGSETTRHLLANADIPAP